MIHVVIGTRAQLIKMIPIMSQLSKDDVKYNFIFLAQHRETIYEILEQFSLKQPDYVVCDNDADIVRTLDMFFWSLKVLWHGFWSRKNIFLNDKEGVVLVHGDAPPLFLGALIAKFQGLKVAQVEAGLRSFDFFKPFPEELTRVLTAKIGLIDYFYCQDKESFNNAKRYRGTVVNTQGNTIRDALRMAKGKFEVDSPYAVVTLHRFETITDQVRMQWVVDKLKEIAEKVPLVFILHPPTRAALIKFNLMNELSDSKNIQLLARMNFSEFNACIKSAEFIVSDGGSNQEESAYLGVPCLLFRNETERSEGIGENVVLSKFDDALIDDFVNNYANYRREALDDDISPTTIILDSLKKYGFNG